MASFLTFVGCSKQPTPAPLEAKVLDLANTTEIALKAFTAIMDAHVKGQNYNSYLESLPKSWRIVYTSISFDGEVNNGGFHQFFWNSEGKWNKETEEDLEKIGAEPFLKLFREARKIYDAHDYPTEKAKSGGSWETFTVGYKEKRMGELDSLYFKEKKSLPSFVGEYLKRNRLLYERK